MTLAGDKLGDKIPDCDMTDPAALESFYGNYSFFEHYRKCVLSNCREIIRATVGVSTKLTVDRVDDLARTHPLYLDFLATHLHGRRLREKNVLDSNAYTR